MGIGLFKSLLVVAHTPPPIDLDLDSGMANQQQLLHETVLALPTTKGWSDEKKQENATGTRKHQLFLTYLCMQVYIRLFLPFFFTDVYAESSHLFL
jgi:hypothetical protein